MYLSELFLIEVNNEYTEESVRKALYKCNNELISRLGPIDDLKKICREYFGYGQDEGRNELFAELMDFWDVYKEFDYLLSLNESKKLLIMKLIFVLH
ncbi:MAG: hypothetical protein ACRC3H_13830 [Lachnospiraceae bacterium]